MKKKFILTKCIHKQLEESGICQGGALILSQAKPSPKQLNLNKLSDAGRNRLFMMFVCILFLLFSCLHAESPVDQFHICTVASKTTPALAQLLASCKHHQFDIDILGHGLPYPRKGNGKKIMYLYDYLKNIPNDHVVMYIDGYDTLVMADKETILNKFLEKKTLCIFAAEIVCWPYKDLAAKYPKSPTKFQYLNAGTFIGYAGYLKKLIEEIGPLKENQSDQGEIALYYVDHPDEILLDFNCELFFPFLLIKDSDLVINTKEKKVQCTVTGTAPCVIHGNGKPGKRLYQLIFNKLFAEKKE